MFYEKRYLQFNDLVFDGYDMISDADEPIQYKGSSTPYSYTHGSYRAFKTSFLYVSERQVNMTITLHMKKIPCEYRKFYAQFVEQELGKPGRLWAIKNDTVLWAFASANNIRPVNNGKPHELVYDIEFVIPGGVWHKADHQKTFVLPYDVCSLMDCKGFEDISSCNCCSTCEDNKIAKAHRDRCDCCCDEDLCREMMLCNHLSELQQYYGCEVPFQLVYSCEAAERLNTERALGQRICVDDICDDSVISGQIYSNTDIPTEDMTITLVGDYVNPWIKINGNTNIIEGEYSGTLIIKSSGDVYYQPCGDGCCEPELLEPNVWVIPSGNTYGWTLNPQLNSVTVYANTCCSQCGMACIFVDSEGITT